MGLVQWYPSPRISERDAQALVDLITEEYKVPHCTVRFTGRETVRALGRYYHHKEKANRSGLDIIKLYHDGEVIGTVLHEVAHHIITYLRPKQKISRFWPTLAEVQRALSYHRKWGSHGKEFHKLQQNLIDQWK